MQQATASYSDGTVTSSLADTTQGQKQCILLPGWESSVPGHLAHASGKNIMVAGSEEKARVRKTLGQAPGRGHTLRGLLPQVGTVSSLPPAPNIDTT